jgi:hypothetical protein
LTAGGATSVRIEVNEEIAGRLDEVASLLGEQGANPFRVRAYRRAAVTLRQLQVPVTEMLEHQGVEGLERLPGIGVSLARAIRDLVAHGRLPMLERLRGESDPVHLLSTVPGIGRVLADRLHHELGLETLADLESAAHDGRLETLAGFGRKRLSGIRDSLAHRLARVRKLPGAAPVLPPVSEILDVDHEYREKAGAGQLKRIAPRRFNPRREAWLPVLHAHRGPRHYTALFSNTARAHRLGKTRDWVVLYFDEGRGEAQCTVITADRGPLAGRRIVVGRERDSARHYQLEPEARSRKPEAQSLKPEAVLIPKPSPMP